MKIFWSFKSIPALAEMPKKERKAIWQRCCWLSFRNWQTWTALAICGCYAALGSILGQIYDAENIGTIIGGATGGFIAGLIIIKVEKRYIREYLKSHDQEPHD